MSSLIDDMNSPCFGGNSLQISEVVNSMKDLIDYSRETGTGPMGKLILFMFLIAPIYFSNFQWVLEAKED